MRKSLRSHAPISPAGKFPTSGAGQPATTCSNNTKKYHGSAPYFGRWRGPNPGVVPADFRGISQVVASLHTDMSYPRVFLEPLTIKNVENLINSFFLISRVVCSVQVGVTGWVLTILPSIFHSRGGGIAAHPGLFRRACTSVLPLWLVLPPTKGNPLHDGNLNDPRHTVQVLGVFHIVRHRNIY